VIAADAWRNAARGTTVSWPLGFYARACERAKRKSGDADLAFASGSAREIISLRFSGIHHCESPQNRHRTPTPHRSWKRAFRLRFASERACRLGRMIRVCFHGSQTTPCSSDRQSVGSPFRVMTHSGAGHERSAKRAGASKVPIDRRRHFKAYRRGCTGAASSAGMTFPVKRLAFVICARHRLRWFGRIEYDNQKPGSNLSPFMPDVNRMQKFLATLDPRVLGRGIDTPRLSMAGPTAFA